MQTVNSQEIKLLKAKKRVKEIKGFYIHLSIYLFVNLMIYVQYFFNIAPDSNVKGGVNFYTAVLWGIVIIIHATAVFLPAIRNWEEEKTNQLMKDHDLVNKK